MIAMILWIAPAKGQAQVPMSPPGELIGCYRVHMSEWSPPLPLGADSVYLEAPSSIRLDTTATVRGRFRILPAMGAAATVHRFATWQPADSGRVVIEWSNGFSGFQALLRMASRDSLRGDARSYWDFGRPSQTATLTLVRLAPPCQ